MNKELKAILDQRVVGMANVRGPVALQISTELFNEQYKLMKEEMVKEGAGGQVYVPEIWSISLVHAGVRFNLHT